MAGRRTGDVVVTELQRILEEFGRIEIQVAELDADRKRVAAVAHRLVQILRATTSAKVSERMLIELGLAERIAGLPGRFGRKPAAKEGKRSAAKRTGKAPKAESVADKAAKARPRKARKAIAPPEILPRRTAVRVLVGKFKDMTGTIGHTHVKGASVSYSLNLRGPDGRHARTQKAHGKLGRTWETIGKVEPGSVPAKRVGEGRGGFRRSKAGEPAATTQAGAGSVAPPFLPEGTAVRMLTGVHLGLAGKVASVRVMSAWPRPNARYTLHLAGTDGRVVRVSMRHSSLGRTWSKDPSATD